MSLLTLIKYLPYLLELVEAIKARNEQDGIDRKVHEDIKTITEAFNEKDATKLNNLFARLSE